MMKGIIAAIATLFLIPSIVFAAGLRGEQGWLRDAPPSAPVRAGYVLLGNDGDRDQVVTGARSPAFGAIEIHEMVDRGDGTMRMRPVPELAVPAGATVELKPGGLHLMLFRPQQPLSSGDVIEIELLLADDETVTIELEQR